MNWRLSKMTREEANLVMDVLFAMAVVGMGAVVLALIISIIGMIL